jgi:hypothetical protein
MDWCELSDDENDGLIKIADKKVIDELNVWNFMKKKG